MNSQLQDWLENHKAVCIWTGKIHNNLTVYGYSIDGKLLVLLDMGKHGFEICTPDGSNSIEHTLLDAEKRLGL